MRNLKLKNEEYLEIHEKIKGFLKNMGISEIKEKIEKRLVEVPLKIDLSSGETLELTTRITTSENGWLKIKALLMFNESIPDDPEIKRTLWEKLLRANYEFPELTYPLDHEIDIFVETDMPVNTTFENFKSEYDNSIEVGALQYFDKILPELNAEIKKTDTFERVRHLYLFTQRSGVIIYDHPFKSIDTAPNLVSGSLSGLSMLIQEITKEQSNVKIIEQEEMTILLEYGKHVTAALITEKNFTSLRKKLRKVISEVEEIHKEDLVKFRGETHKFSELGVVAEKHF